MPPIPRYERAYYVEPDNSDHQEERIVLDAGADRGQLTRVLGRIGGKACNLYVPSDSDPVLAGSYMSLMANKVYCGDEVQWATPGAENEV